MDPERPSRSLARAQIRGKWYSPSIGAIHNDVWVPRRVTPVFVGASTPNRGTSLEPAALSTAND
jgi:hypothetical protein